VVPFLNPCGAAGTALPNNLIGRRWLRRTTFGGFSFKEPAIVRRPYSRLQRSARSGHARHRENDDGTAVGQVLLRDPNSQEQRREVAQPELRRAPL